MLTRNSAPSGAPAALKRWPKTPKEGPSWYWLVQVATKLPLASEATVGRACVKKVNVFTWNSAPNGAPAALKRCPKMPRWFPSCA